MLTSKVWYSSGTKILNSNGKVSEDVIRVGDYQHINTNGAGCTGQKQECSFPTQILNNKKKDEEKRIIYVCALVFGQFPLQTTCKAMSTMIMYFFIVSFIWLFLEALNIYLELVVLFHSLRKFAKHFYVIWGK